MRLKSHVRFGGGSEEKCQVSLGYEVTRLFPTLPFFHGRGSGESSPVVVGVGSGEYSLVAVAVTVGVAVAVDVAVTVGVTVAAGVAVDSSVAVAVGVNVAGGSMVGVQPPTTTSNTSHAPIRLKVLQFILNSFLFGHYSLSIVPLVRPPELGPITQRQQTRRGPPALVAKRPA
jgi:hypothetical protein